MEGGDTHSSSSEEYSTRVEYILDVVWSPRVLASNKERERQSVCVCVCVDTYVYMHCLSDCLTQELREDTYTRRAGWRVSVLA